MIKINLDFQLIFYLRKKQYTKFYFEIFSPNILVTFSNINFNCLKTRRDNAALEIKEGRSVGRTVLNRQKSHNFCDFVQVESTAHC